MRRLGRALLVISGRWFGSCSCSSQFAPNHWSSLPLLGKFSPCRTVHEHELGELIYFGHILCSVCFLPSEH